MQVEAFLPSSCLPYQYNGKLSDKLPQPRNGRGDLRSAADTLNSGRFTSTQAPDGSRTNHKQPRYANKGCRRLWEHVKTVGRGELMSSDTRPGAEWSVEEIVRLVVSLPPSTCVVTTVAPALHHLDSRATAALLKELARARQLSRALDIFQWLCSLEPHHPLTSLADVYTFTTAVSLMGQAQQLRGALELVADMRSRGHTCNVHTYSALMNVCVKCDAADLALDVFNQMRAEGITPNVVTYNTLVDVYGKRGAWEQAVGVLADMAAEGLQPEVRTYNTAIIACNMCGQPLEAIKVYQRLLEARLTPVSTTYTALISAYGKAGKLDAALDTFSAMVAAGCERSVLTYSALIGAAEKAGRWEAALALGERMARDGCAPNTVTVNSLIMACAQGGLWQKAKALFEQMKAQGCRPDVVTYSSLLAAYRRGDQWRSVVKTFYQMLALGCKPDSHVYLHVVDLLWSTGVAWAQARALQVYGVAARQWPYRFTVQHSTPDESTLELTVPGSTLALAAISLHKYLLGLRGEVEAGSPAAAALLGRQQVRVTLGRGRGGRDGGGSSGGGSAAGGLAHTTSEALQGQLAALGAPFRPQGSSGPCLRCLEAPVPSLLAWLKQPSTAARLLALFLPASCHANQHPGGGRAGPAGGTSGGELMGDAAVEVECRAALEGARQGERRLSVAAGRTSPAAGSSTGSGPGRGSSEDGSEAEGGEPPLLPANAEGTLRRASEVGGCLSLPADVREQRGRVMRALVTMGSQLLLGPEVVHGALALVDPLLLLVDPLVLGGAAGGATSSSGELLAALVGVEAGPCAQQLLAGILLQAAARASQLEQQAPTRQLLAALFGCPEASVAAAEARVHGLLDGDCGMPASPLACLKVYLHRLGQVDALGDTGLQQQQPQHGLLALLQEVVLDARSAGFSPSLLAAATLVAYRAGTGTCPAWPAVLASLTGWASPGAVPALDAALAVAAAVAEDHPLLLAGPAPALLDHTTPAAAAAGALGAMRASGGSGGACLVAAGGSDMWQGVGAGGAPMDLLLAAFPGLCSTTPAAATRTSADLAAGSSRGGDAPLLRLPHRGRHRLPSGDGAAAVRKGQGPTQGGMRLLATDGGALREGPAEAGLQVPASSTAGPLHSGLSGVLGHSQSLVSHAMLQQQQLEVAQQHQQLLTAGHRHSHQPPHQVFVAQHQQQQGGVCREAPLLAGGGQCLDLLGAPVTGGFPPAAGQVFGGASSFTASGQGFPSTAITQAYPSTTGVQAFAITSSAPAFPASGAGQVYPTPASNPLGLMAGAATELFPGSSSSSSSSSQQPGAACSSMGPPWAANLWGGGLEGSASSGGGAPIGTSLAQVAVPQAGGGDGGPWCLPAGGLGGLTVGELAPSGARSAALLFPAPANDAMAHIWGPVNQLGLSTGLVAASGFGLGGGFQQPSVSTISTAVLQPLNVLGGGGALAPLAHPVTHSAGDMYSQPLALHRHHPLLVPVGISTAATAGPASLVQRF